MKFNKILMAGLALGASLAFTSCDDDELDPNPLHDYSGSGVNFASFGPTPILRLDTMEIYGDKLNKVSKVIFPNAEVEKSAFVSASSEKISVVIPDESRPGKIGLYCGGSDTVWSKTPIVFQEPIEVKAFAPAGAIMPGTQLTIKGEYVYNIASVTFEVGQIVNAEDFVKCERRELVVNVPMGAVSGEVVFSDGADWTYKKSLEVLAASYTSLSTDSLDFGQELTINGQNLNLVEKVTFAGGVAAENFTVAADGKSIKVNVPADAAPGAVTLTQYSLVSVSTEAVKLPVISVEDVNPKTELDAGMTVTITGNLLNRVQKIVTGGNKEVTDFAVNAEGTLITFVAPDGMADGKITLVQNANLSAETVLVKMRKKGNLFYTVSDSEPAFTSTNWGNWFQVAYNNEAQQLWRETITEPGKLTVNVNYCDNPDGYRCVQMQHISVADGWHNPIQADLAEGQTAVTFEITAEDVDLIQSVSGGDGLVFGGYGVGIASFEWESSSAPKAVWEGDAEVSWNNAVTLPYADVESYAGKTMYITYNVVPADYHMIRIINSDWSFNPEDDATYNLNMSEDGVWEKTIDAELLDKLGGKDMSFTGFGVHISKIAVK